MPEEERQEDEEVPPVPQLCDNKASLTIACHPSNQSRVRHWYVREFRIRDFQEEKLLRVFWCPTAFNLADFFTKPLKRVKFSQALPLLGIVGCPAVARPTVSEVRAAEDATAIAQDNLLYSSPSAQGAYLVYTVTNGRVLPWESSPETVTFDLDNPPGY